MDASNCNGHLLFGVNGSMVQTTVCNGKVLMKDREVLVCDEEKVMADCRRAAKELADDINSCVCGPAAGPTGFSSFLPNISTVLEVSATYAFWIPNTCPVSLCSANIHSISCPNGTGT